MSEKPMFCGRCGVSIPSSWEYSDMSCGGYIRLNRSSQLFAPYSDGVGNKRYDYDAQFKTWDAMKAHPAFKKAEAQSAEIVYGNDNYRLCYHCNDELIKTIGRFFGVGYYQINYSVSHSINQKGNPQ